jgi:hypothetical protein
MKKLTTIVTSLLLMLVSLQSNASLIQLDANLASYEAGDTVLLDIFIKDISLETAELGFSLGFDSTAISFDSFSYSDDVLNSSPFQYEADLSYSDDNIVDFFVIWWDSIDLPDTSFSLGQVSFTALQSYDPSFYVTDAYLADYYGDDLGTPDFLTNASVPEPSTSLIMLCSLLMLPLQKKLFAKRK